MMFSSSFEVDDLSVVHWPAAFITINSISQLSNIPPYVMSISIQDTVGYFDSSFTSFHFSSYPILRTIDIGNFCFKYAREFVLDGLEQLESVKIGDGCFIISNKEHNDGLLRITNCPNLTQLEIGNESFRDYMKFELSNVNSLQSIQFGSSCFFYAENCILKGE